MRNVFARSLMSLYLAVCLLVGLTGCSSVTKGSGPDGTLTPDEFSVAMARNEADTQVASGIATTVVLLSLEPADRAEFGQYAYTVASAVHKVADDGTVDLTRLEGLAAEMIQKSNVRNKELVGFLLTSLTMEIRARVGGLKLGDDQRSMLVRGLVRGAAAGVKSATVQYRPPITSVMPNYDAMWQDEPTARWLFRRDLSFRSA